jgi:GT2 family glycosyltransferase
LNDVVAELEGSVAVLLNNDVQLDPGCIDPLVQPLLECSTCFLAAPLCWRPDGAVYEGFRTAVRWRWGLVQATALFPGHEAAIRQPGLTASAGAVMAVDCRKFTELGGFDPLYLPGRLEDLDFAFRGYKAGYQARYVPTAVAYHQGMATFEAVHGQAECDRLALRNTLLFQWKNLRHPRHLLRQAAGLSFRLLRDVAWAPWVGREERWGFVRAFCSALARRRGLRRGPGHRRGTIREELAFFRRFHPRAMRGKDARVPRASCPCSGETSVPPSRDPTALLWGKSGVIPLVDSE